MKEFFQELRSKRIYRVAGGYIVSAWVILQVAAIVSPSLDLPSWTIKAVLDVLLLGFVPALLLGWHLDLRRGRAERSSLLKKDVAGGPKSPSEHTPLGEGKAGLDAKRPAMQTAPRGEKPEKVSVSRLPITGSDLFGREEDIAFLDRAWANKEVNVVTIVAWGGVGNRPWSTIGSDEWLLKSIVLQSWFLAGPFTDRAPAGTLRPQTNSWTLPSLGLAIQIHGAERHGKKAKD